jgi:hypothetical protein
VSSFFDQYAPYGRLIDSGRYSRCIDEAFHLLRSIEEFSSQLYETTHKGTPATMDSHRTGGVGRVG